MNSHLPLPLPRHIISHHHHHHFNLHFSHHFSNILTPLLLCSLAHAQVYHLSNASARFLHEKANNTYTVPAAFLAELTTTSVGLLTFIPGTAVTYFMMGFENESYPFMMFVYWMVSTQAICTIHSKAM
jgi:hypothetical protein